MQCSDDVIYGDARSSNGRVIFGHIRACKFKAKFLVRGENIEPLPVCGIHSKFYEKHPSTYTVEKIERYT